MPEVSLILPVMILFYGAMAARFLSGSWFAPSAFFCGIWLLQIGLSRFAPQYRLTSTALWTICLSCLVVLGGSLVGRAVAARLRASSEEPLQFVRPGWALLIATALGSFYTVLFQQAGLYATEYATESPHSAYQVLLAFQFAGPLIGGLLYSSRRLQPRGLGFLPLLPPGVLALVYTGRTAIIAPMLFWLSGYIVGRILPWWGQMPRVNGRLIIAAALLLASFTIIGVVLQMFRDVYVRDASVRERLAVYRGALSQENFGDTRERFVSWSVFGQVYALSLFLEDERASSRSPRGGRVIFAAPLDLIGYEGSRYPFESLEIEGGTLSNVFTAFSIPIADFGYAGALVWWLIIGAVQGFAFERTKTGGLLSAVVLAWFYVDTAVIGGFFFRYNSIILAYALAAGYLLYSHSRTTQRGQLRPS